MPKKEMINELVRHKQEMQNDFGWNTTLQTALDAAIEALKAAPCGDTISRKHLLSEIDDLMKSPWFNNGKDDDMFTHYGYVERKEAVEIVRDLCVKAEPSVTSKQDWIPDNATNGDVIKAILNVEGYTPFIWHNSKSGFRVHIEHLHKDDFQLSVSNDWWNAPYKKVR